jgi:uncharacterized phage protein gp47/JayE
LPFPRPTLTQLMTQVIQQINSAQITDQNGNVLVMLLQRAVLRILANVFAGLSYEHYGYLDYIALQAVPVTATGEFLDAWAALKAIFRQAATATQGTATFVCTNNSGVPAGLSIVRSDGTTFTTTAAALPSDGLVTVPFTATVAGTAGNFEGATQFLLGSQINGIGLASTTSAQTVAGTDLQTDDSLRTEMLLAYTAPPQGGDRQDYIEFALAVPGVTRAWVLPNGLGAGTVLLYVMLDQAEAANGGFPQGTNGVATNETRGTAATGDQLNVANQIFAPPPGQQGQPVTALVTVMAPTDEPVAFTVANLGSNNTPANQALITAALQGMLLISANVGGTVNPETGAPWPPVTQNDWFSAVNAISGLTTFSIPVPSGPITPANGSLFTLGPVTFSS